MRVHRVVAAVDCGRHVNPETIRAQIEGSIVFGLSAALKGEITIANGRVEQSNFNDYDLVRINEAPVVEVRIVESQDGPGGIGEPGTPPIAPAVCNAIYAATGKPVRRLPIRAEGWHRNRPITESSRENPARDLLQGRKAEEWHGFTPGLKPRPRKEKALHTACEGKPFQKEFLRQLLAAGPI